MNRPAPSRVATWQDAESNAAQWTRYLGYADAVTTSGGADGGVDVRGAGVLAQVKFRAHQTSAPDVQRLVGAAGRRSTVQLMFYTGTSYSRQALACAAKNDVALFTYDLTGVVHPVGPIATQLLRAADDRQADRAPLPVRVTAESDTGPALPGHATPATDEDQVSSGWAATAVASLAFVAATTLLIGVAGAIEGPAPGMEGAAAGVRGFGAVAYVSGLVALWRGLSRAHSGGGLWARAVVAAGPGAGFWVTLAVEIGTDSQNQALTVAQALGVAAAMVAGVAVLAGLRSARRQAPVRQSAPASRHEWDHGNALARPKNFLG